ncbi:MAG: hypothetical protein HYZ14_11930 [Bacteroidetes bacterium]|nr:hypothetical protein [Bacteroidota bacterium]
MTKLSHAIKFFITFFISATSFGQNDDWDWNWPVCDMNDSVRLHFRDDSTFAKIEGGWMLVKETDKIGITEMFPYFRKPYDDIAFYNDTVFRLDYPCTYNNDFRVLVLKDTLLTIWKCPDSYHVQFIGWSADTLILTNYYGGGGFNYSKEYYVRKDIPYESVKENIDVILNTACLDGVWDLSDEQREFHYLNDSTSKGIYVFDNETGWGNIIITAYEPFQSLDFGVDGAQKFTNTNDTITLLINSEQYQFLISEYSIFNLGQIDLIPLCGEDCKYVKLTYIKREDD